MSRPRREPYTWVHRRIEGEIEQGQIHRHQRIPGMEADDVKSEMLLALWRAHRSWDPAVGATIEQYWWAVWTRRRVDLIAYHLRECRDVRREQLVPHEFWWWYEDEATVEEHGRRLQRYPVIRLDQDAVPPAPPGVDDKAAQVWGLLCRGYTRQDVLLRCDISKRCYYQILDRFREVVG